MRAPDYIADLPRYDTNQVPTNLTVGTGTTCSDTFVADWSQLLVGIKTRIQITTLTERYADYGEIGFLA